MVVGRDRAAVGPGAGYGEFGLNQQNPEINSSMVISSTSISFRRLVGNLRRSEGIKSPLRVCSGNCVTGS